MTDKIVKGPARAHDRAVARSRGKPAPKKKKPPGGARDAILAAAERRLTRDGPSALRLQDVAADAGVTHPNVLHHFGSREGLVAAVVERAVGALEDDLVRAVQAPGAPDGSAMLDRVFETLAERGHARLLAWLLLSGYEPLRSERTREQWRAIIDATHAARVAASPGGPPSREDTAFTVVLSALAIFGQAIAGRSTLEMAGLGGGAEVGRRFRAWLGGVLGEHLGASRR